MDIIRNVGVRETCGDTSVKSAENLHHRYSLPNINFKETEHIKSNRQVLVDTKPPIISHQANANQSQLSKTFGRQYTVSEPQEDECAVSGRLEIRVLPQEQSPNPEESIYFDAMTNGGGAVVNIRSDIIETKSSKSKDTSMPAVPNRDIEKKPSIFRTASQVEPQLFNRSQSDTVVKPLIKAKPTVDQINSKIQEIELSRSLALGEINKANVSEPVIEKPLTNIDLTNKKTHIDTTNKREFPLMYHDEDVPSTEFPKQMPHAMTTDCSVSSQGPVAGITTGGECFGVIGQRMTMSHSQSSSCGAANVDGSLNKKERDGSSSSRIPIFNPNLRISKCASWAGGECPHSPEIQDLTPGKLIRLSSVLGFCFPFFVLSDLHVVF